jgi:hypothetical protein
MKIFRPAIAILALCVTALAQRNVDVGAADGANESTLVTLTSGDTSRLLLLARTPYPHVGHRLSVDSGQTWHGSDSVPFSGSNGNNPWLAVDNDSGYAYAVFISKVVRSTNYGWDWSATTVQMDTAPSHGFDAPCIAVDNSNMAGTKGNVYVSWSSRFDDVSHVWVSRSTDRGLTFSTPVDVVVEGHDWVAGMTALAVNGDGIVSCFYARPGLAKGDGSFSETFSTDGGLTWSVGKTPSVTALAGTLQLAIGSRSYSIAAQPKGRMICTALLPYFRDYPIGGSNPDSIGVSVSTDSGLYPPRFGGHHSQLVDFTWRCPHGTEETAADIRSAVQTRRG